MVEFIVLRDEYADKDTISNTMKKLTLILKLMLFAVLTSMAAPALISPSHELQIDPDGTDVGFRQTNAFYKTLACAATNALPGDTILIHAGNYFERLDQINGQQIFLPQNVTVMAYGATVEFTNVSASVIASLELASNDRIYGGIFTNCYYPGEAFVAGVIGTSGNWPGATNAYLQDVTVLSPDAGFIAKSSNVSSITYYNCLANAGYAGWAQEAAATATICRNCTAIVTNLSPITAANSRTGFKNRGALSGTLELYDCKAVVNDLGGGIYPAYAINTKLNGETTRGQIRLQNVVIDTTGCTNALSVDIGVSSQTNAVLMNNVTRLDGAPLNLTNTDGTGILPVTYLMPPNPLVTVNTSSKVTFNPLGYEETQVNTSGSTIARLTINLPSASSARQVVRYVTAGNCTKVTVEGTVLAGAAVKTLAANSSVAWQAVNTGGTWVRIQ